MPAFRELISGQARGVWPAVARAALSALEAPYTAAVRWRNWRYDTGRARTDRVSVPVVSVGNLTLGGTGKTPAVEWLARWFMARGVRVALLSRGYGAKSGQANDESLELRQKLPQVPQVLDANRVRGARQAIDQFNCELLLLDDAFQHRRLDRDLNIVLVDASEPFGFGHVFPRGTLREPLDGWKRADVVMLTRAESLENPRRREIREQVTRYCPAAIWTEASYVAIALVSHDGTTRPLAELRASKIAAFCGIGNPASFRRSLERLDYDVVGWREFADHFAYPPRAVSDLTNWAKQQGAAAAVCTSKDLVKLGSRWHGEVPLSALVSRLEITSGLAELETRLGHLIQHRRGQ